MGEVVTPAPNPGNSDIVPKGHPGGESKPAMRGYLADLTLKTPVFGDFGSPEQPHFTARQTASLYGIAVIAVAIAFAVRLALQSSLGDESRYLFFVPAVLIASGLAGLGPGLLATVLSMLLAMFVLNSSNA